MKIHLFYFILSSLFIISHFPFQVNAQLPISTNGKCGPEAKTRCPDQKCCSRGNWCGVDKIYCGTGCQAAFGRCDGVPPSLPISTNGKCGPEAKTRCPNQKCCSKGNWCGLDKSHCGTGCQAAFGKCGVDTPKEPTKCTVRPRKEVRKLSQNEWKTYVSAVKSLHQRSSPTSPAKIDYFTRTHIELNLKIHSGSEFLPYHRYFIREYEKELQKFDSSVMLPYWDSSVDSQAPEQSKILSSQYYGSNGSGPRRCVNDGAFAGLSTLISKDSNNRTITKPHCLTRAYMYAPKLPAWTSPEEIDYITQTTSTFSDFTQDIQNGFHGYVHSGLGGDMGLLKAPNDPLFMVHHAFVDKIWADFQARGARFTNLYDGSNSNGNNAKLSDILPSTKNIKVSEVFDTKNLCYTYESSNDLQRRDLESNIYKKQLNSIPDLDYFSSETKNTLIKANKLINQYDLPVSIDTMLSESEKFHILNKKDTDPLGLSIHIKSNDFAKFFPKLADPYTPTHINTKKITNIIKNQSKNVISSVKTPDFLDRTNKNLLRASPPLPEMFINMMKQDIKKVRAYEAKVKNFINGLNNAGYKSPACLENRPYLLSKIITTKVATKVVPELKN